MKNLKLSSKAARKKQWGTEKSTNPLPMLHKKPSTRKIALSRIAIIVTISFWILYFISTVLRQFLDGASSFEFTMQAAGYLIVVTFLTLSALVYLITRQGALQRFNMHVRVPRSKLDEYFSKKQPFITVLVPSYAEEPEVIKKTLLSAALQEYPKKRIVLLIDDPIVPSSKEAEIKLNMTRNIAKELMKLFSEPKIRLTHALEDFQNKYEKKQKVEKRDIKRLIDHYLWVIYWLNKLADDEKIEDHVDRFFADQVLRALADDLKLIADALTASCKESSFISVDKVYELYNRLIWIFSTEVDIFERKKYASLSHEANKAMNLNSYIGLMGGSYVKKQTPAGTLLLPLKDGEKADLVIPDSDFILTLDADSILLREYCLRLVYYLEEPNNSKVAVTQTPYSSFRGAGTRIERLAGATTDIQHILHQGMSYYDATFWVGANAVIRKKALDDIRETTWVGGFPIHRFIQDRTVIEDTESSIDLTMHGWELVNYPERLSYSATPPDFGSLIVQRRRWANGGLLILPKFLSQIGEKKRKGEFTSKMEILIRVNYMASIAWSNFGLIFLLAFPYASSLLSPLIILSSLPYFLCMAEDLKDCGYNRADVFRIYGFNLILLPVSIAGVLKSLEQAITGSKIPFARTPKVKDRTLSPALYILSPVFIIGFSIFTLWRDIMLHNWGNAAFAGFNAIVATWAFVSYIGIYNALIDLWTAFINWLYIEVTISEPEFNEDPTDIDWRSILYYGEVKDKDVHKEMTHFNVYTLLTDGKEL